jgi:branched-chain amino acid transport system substrate-binding protein
MTNISCKTVDSCRKTRVKSTISALTKLQAIIIVAIIIVAGVAGGLLYYTTQQQAMKKPFKIGAMFPFTGPYGTQAIEQKNAFLLAIEEINKEGGILGRPVEAVIYDDQLKVDIAVSLAHKLVEVDQVDILFGTLSASSAYAVHEEAKKLHKIYVSGCLMYSDGFVKEKMAGSGTIAIVGHAWNLGYIDAAFVAEHLPEVKTVYLVIPAYTFGYDTRDGFLEGLKQFAPHIKVLGVVEAPVGAADFTPYLSKVLEAKPDLVFISQAGHDLGTILKQAYELGIQKKMKIINPWSWIKELAPLPPEATEGVYFTMWYYWNTPHPGIQEYAKKYMDKYGEPPDNFGGFVYVATKEIARLINLMGTTDPKKLEETMLKHRNFNTMKGPAYWRDDHQPVMENYVFILKGKPAEKRINKWDVAEVVAVYGGEKYLKPLSLEGY